MTYTDEDGEYSLDNLPIGDRYRLVASRSGSRRSRSDRVSIASQDEVATANVILKER